MNYLHEKAEDNFKMAQESTKHDCFDVAVSRFYYYIFQSLKDFLIKNDKFNTENKENIHIYTIGAMIKFTKDKGYFKKNSRSIIKLWGLKERRVESDYNDLMKIENQKDFEKIFMRDFDEVMGTLRKLRIL